MSYIQLPDGRYFEIMPGENPAQARLAAMQKYPEVFGIKGTEAAPEQKSGFFANVGKGIGDTLGNLGTAAVAPFAPETAGRAAVADAKQPETVKTTNFQDVQDAFGQGTMSGIGTLGAFARDQIASNLPNMALSLGGAKLGAMAGAPLGPAGSLVGAGVGAFIPSLATQFGSNVQRQAVEQDRAGQPLDISRGAALGAAIPQAGLDTASTFFTLGKLGVAKIGGKPVQEAMKATGVAAEKELLKAAERSVTGNVARGFGRGVAAEMPTEIAQQILERAQAGQPITGDEANREYLEVAAAAGIVGGALGGAANFGAKGAGQQLQKQKAAEAFKNQQDQLKAERQQLLSKEAPASQYPPSFAPQSVEPNYEDQTYKAGYAAPSIFPFNPQAGVPSARMGGVQPGEPTALVQGNTLDAGASAFGKSWAETRARNDAILEAERLASEERAAEEARLARVAEIEGAGPDKSQRSQYNMLALPGIMRDGVVDSKIVAEVEQGADSGVPTAAFAKVTGLPSGFMKADPATQYTMAEARHAEIVKELGKLERDRQSRPSQVDARRRALTAQMELLHRYGLAAPGVAEQAASGGPQAIAAAEDLQPGFEAPSIADRGPAANGVESLQKAAEAPPRITPPPAPLVQEQMDLPGTVPQPDWRNEEDKTALAGPMSEGVVAEQLAELEGQKRAAENVLRTAPDDTETLDELERLKSPFQKARERQMALRAREELRSALQENRVPEEIRPLMESVYDTLATQQADPATTMAKERLQQAAAELLYRVRNRAPYDPAPVQQALAAMQPRDAQSGDLFFDAVSKQEAKTAKKFREGQQRREDAKVAEKEKVAGQKKQKEWVGEVRKAVLALNNAKKAAAAATEQANAKAQVLFPLLDKLTAVNRALDSVNRADQSGTLNAALEQAEAEGMREGPRVATPQWAVNLRNQLEPARDQLGQQVDKLVEAVNKKLRETQAKLAEEQTRLKDIRENTPAAVARKEQLAKRQEQINAAQRAAQEARAKAAIARGPRNAPVDQGPAQRRIGQVPGTTLGAKVTNEVLDTPFRTEQGDVKLQARRIERPPTPINLGWAKSPEQLNLEAQAEATRKRGEKAASMAQARAAKKEGQRGQTQDPFTTRKAAAERTVGDPSSHETDPQQRLLQAGIENIKRRYGDNPTAKQTRDGLVYAAMDLLDDPASLGIHPLHAKALQAYLSLLDGLTQDVTVTFKDSLTHAGKYFAADNSIQLDSQASVPTFIHELAHAATVRTLANTISEYRMAVADPPVEDIRKATPDQIIKLARGLKKEGTWPAVKADALENLAMAWGFVEEDGAYGGANILEFVAEWYADPSFASLVSNKLAGLPLKDVTPQAGFYAKLRRLADKVRNYMADFLGLKGLARTAFERISDSITLFHDNSQMQGGLEFFGREKKPNMEHLSPKLQGFSDVIQHKKDPGLWDTIRANITGLGFRFNFLDQGAGYQETLDRAKEAGKLDDTRYIRASWAYRQANLTSHYLNSILGDKEAFVNPETGLVDLRDSQNTLMRNAELLAEAGVPEGETTYQLYRLAKRAKRVGVDRLRRALGNEGLDSTWTKERVEEAARLNEQYPVFDQLDKVENARNHTLIDLLVDSGRMTKEEGDLLKSFDDYVPFYRAEEDGTLYLVHDDTREVAIGKIDDPHELAALKGGKGKIKPYFTNAITNTRYILNSALRNNALRESVKVMTDMKMGFDVGKKTSPTRTLSYFEGGEEKFFEVSDTYIEDTEDFKGLPAEIVAGAFMGSRYALPSALKLMQGPARLLRYTVTRNPLYTIRQLLREPLTSNFTTGNNTLPVVGALQALIGAKQEYKDARKTLERYGVVGGQVLTGTSEDARLVLKNLTEGKTTFGKAMQMLDRLAMNADMSTRETIYANAIKQGMSEPEAALMALESMNFTRHGALPAVQVASMLVPFLNAQLQGLDVLYKAARGKMAFNDRLGIQKKFVARAMMMAGFSMLYASAMSDEEPWKSANEQERDMNWFVPVPGVEGAWIKVPVNFEIGYLFKALPERMVAMTNGDDKGSSVLKSLGAFAAQSFPNPIPQAIKPMLEWWTNYSFFTGRPIQTERMLSLDPSQRFTERTSETAKSLGQATEFTLPSGQKVGLSPAVIEHLVRGYTSQLGMVVMQTAGSALESMDGTQRAERPARELHETPLFGPMLANTRGFGPTNKFYEIKTELDRRANTLKDLQQQNPERARQYAQDYAQDAALSKVANQISAKLNDLRKQQARIWYSEADPDEKQRKIRQLRDAEIQLVGRFNVQYNALR